MSKRRPNGDGTVRKRPDGRWEARIIVGHKENKKPIYKSVFGLTQAEAMAKFRKLQEVYQGVELTEDCMHKGCTKGAFFCTKYAPKTEQLMRYVKMHKKQAEIL